MDFATLYGMNNPPIGPIEYLLTMLARKTNKMEMRENMHNVVSKLNQQFPGFINGVQSIKLSDLHLRTGMAADFIMEWLIAAPREDGKPKMLDLFRFKHHRYARALIDRIKEVSNENNLLFSHIFILRCLPIQPNRPISSFD